MLPVFFALCALTARIHAGGLADSWEVYDQQFDHPLKSGLPIHMENLYGNVRIKTSGDRTVTIVATCQKHREDTDLAVVDVLMAEGMRISVRYPGDAERAGELPERFAKRRVDIAVLVPEGVPCEIATDSGLIEASVGSSPMSARSTSGNIFIKGGGVISAYTDGGWIRAVLKKGVHAGRCAFRTRTGDISLQFFRPSSANVRMATQGTIASDYSMRVKRLSGNSGKVATARVGGPRGIGRLFGFLFSKATVDIESVNGNVKLLAPVPEFQPVQAEAASI